MAKRKKMSYKGSKKYFRKNTGSKTDARMDGKRTIMRGGYRL